MTKITEELHRKIVRVYGEPIIEVPKKYKPDQLWYYDKNSQYSTQFLAIEKFPVAKNIKIFNKPPKEYDGVIIKVKAIRRENRLGMVLNQQMDLIQDEEIFLFREEYFQIFQQEFVIIELSQIRYLVFQKQEANEKIVESVTVLRQQKAEATGVERKVIKQELNSLMINYFYKEETELDRLSLSYLQSLCRIEMYKLFIKYDGVGLCIDELTTTHPVEELTDNEDWKVKHG